MTKMQRRRNRNEKEEAVEGGQVWDAQWFCRRRCNSWTTRTRLDQLDQLDQVGDEEEESDKVPAIARWGAVGRALIRAAAKKVRGKDSSATG